MAGLKRKQLFGWLSYLYTREKRRLRKTAMPVSGEGGTMNGGSKPDDHQVIDQICSPDSEVRLSAAKELPKISDPQAPDALVRLLEDEDLSVRWAAMQSLTSTGRKAIEPLLVALTHDFPSSNLRQGARHIFQTLNEYGMLNRGEVQVMHTLEKSTHAVEVATAANKALLTNMKINSQQHAKKYVDMDCK